MNTWDKDFSSNFPSNEIQKQIEVSVKELIQSGTTTILTGGNINIVQNSTITYDKREGVLQVVGDFRSPHTSDLHYAICKSICYSFLFNIFHIALADGGNGKLVPVLADFRDPAINKFKIV